jgi:hypothetical protein
MRSSLRDVELPEYTTLSDNARYERSSVSETQ